MAERFENGHGMGCVAVEGFTSIWNLGVVMVVEGVPLHL
jgi:hypothetical protein